MSGKKKGTGRKKVLMEKIKSETNLQVTFSKRRQGIFKKATELTTLTGAEAAVVIFSPADKPHSFGHPDVHSVINRFLSRRNLPPENAASPADRILSTRENAAAAHRRRNDELIRTEVELEKEKKRKQELDRFKRVGQEENIIPIISKLGLVKLEQLSNSLNRFKEKLLEEAAKMQHVTLANTVIHDHSNEFSWRMDGDENEELNIGFPIDTSVGGGGGSTMNRLPVAFPASFGGSYTSAFLDPYNLMAENLGFRTHFPDCEAGSSAGGAAPEIQDLGFSSPKFI